MTDDEIQKEREQVNKMIGAKSAMEASLHRIKTLESALFEMHTRYSEIAKCVGDSVIVESRYARGYWEKGETKPAKITDLKEGVDRLLSKHTGPTS